MSGADRPLRVLRNPPVSAIGEVPGPFLFILYCQSDHSLLAAS